MDQQLNCFQWRRYLSDLLDQQRESIHPESSSGLERAKEHIEGCQACETSYQRYQRMISLIQSQSKAALPDTLKKSPLTAILPQITSSQFSLSRWEKLPWYLRITVETSGVIALILLAISSGPQLRNWYEQGINKKIGDLKDFEPGPEVAKDFATENVPAPVEHAQAAVTGGVTQAESSGEEDEISGENEGSDDYKVGNGHSQLWRFTLKTVSPDELRQDIVKTLADLKLSEKTPGFNGVQVPGGIEFKMILPEVKIPEIKAALQKLALTPSDQATITPGSEPFTWYRVKSKKKVPEGKAQVIIWLSQPN